jgi:uncharacterized protein YqeY
MLHQKIKDSIKEAMLAKDSVRLTVLRGLLSAFTNELVATKRTPQEMLSDEEVLNVIRRAVKQRKDSIDQFEKGGRPELAEDEKKELAILETYLPTLMSREEIKKVVEAKKAEMGTVDKTKLGVFMGAVMKDLKGKADGADVKAVIDEVFA